MKHLIFISVFVISMLYGNNLPAQSCCSGGIPLSGNIGLPSSDKGSFQINLSYDLNYLSRLKSGSEYLDNSNRKRFTQSSLFNVAYSLDEHFSFEAFSTYIRQDRIIISGSTTNHDFISGIGDAAFLVRYNNTMMENLKGNLFLGIGPKFPLGKSDLKNSSGIVLNADMQPGSGSWDLISFLQYSIAPAEDSSVRSFLRLSYFLRGRNKQYLETLTYKSGDEFSASIGINDMISSTFGLWNYSLSTRFRYSEFDEIDGSALPNTGGSWLYGSASLGYNLSYSLLLHLSGEFPLYSKPDGTQLNTSVRLNIGLFKNFGNNYSSLIIK